MKLTNLKYNYQGFILKRESKYIKQMIKKLNSKEKK